MIEQKIFKTLSGEEQKIPPVWLMRQAGRYLPEYLKIRKKYEKFTDLCLSTEDVIEITCQPIRRFDFDAAILFSDILIVPHLIGREFFFDEKKGPITEKISCEEDLNLLSLENFHKKASNIYDSVREIRNILPKDKSLIVFTASIWTLIYYIIRDNTDDITQDYKFYKTIYEKPQWLVRLIHLLKEVSVEYIEKLIDSGADIVKIFDTHASQIPDEVLLSYCFEQHLEIMRRVKKKHPKTPFICFPKGIGVRYHEYVKKINPDILAIDSKIPLDYASSVLKKEVTIQGNLDPITLVVGGNALDTQVNRILDNLAGKNFIFNLGHGIRPETDIANVERMMKIIRNRCND